MHASHGAAIDSYLAIARQVLELTAVAPMVIQIKGLFGLGDIL
jgi:hypothetical protein